MSLPAREIEEKTYSESDLQHLVAREWAKTAILQLQSGQIELQKQLVELNGTFIAELRAFRESMSLLPAQLAAQIRECRADLRKEIESDFPSKIETMNMEQRIEKQIAETDKTLGKQIADVDKKLDDKMAEVTVQITKVDTKIEKLWIRLSMVVLTLMAAGGVVQWLLLTYKAASAGL